MKNLIISIGISLLTVLSSCEKYLDKKSNSALVTPQKLEDFQGLLDDGAIMNIRTTPSYSESSTDDFFLLPATYTSLTEGNRNYYAWQPYLYNFSNDWSKAYLAIYNSNLCLDELPGIATHSGNQQAWDNIKGSALFYRAFYFAHLLWTFTKAYDEQSSTTDLGIVLRLGSDFNIPSVRSSVQQSYDRVLEDAKTAITFLPAHPQHVYRPSKAAAYALLARVYLSMRKYPQAALYADSTLQLKNQLMDYNGDSDINGNISAAVPFKKENKEIIFYTEMNTTFGLHVPARAKIDTLLYSSYDVNDLRRTAYFRANAGYQQFKGSYAANASLFFSGIAVDEVLLIRAECRARTNQIPEAMEDLNTLMKKRWRNTISYPEITADDAMEALNKILEERRKELIMRGVRWMDIKRLNKDNRAIVLRRNIEGRIISLEPNAAYYALPLPYDIINITGLQQNE
jgi:hypothetical protein